MNANLSRRGFLRTAAIGTAGTAAAGAAAAQEDDDEDGEETPTPEDGEDGDGEDGDGEDGGDGGGVPDFGAYLQDANGYQEGQVADHRGDDEVTVTVGAGDDGLAFDPPTIWIDPETTVIWEWTGAGGGHNVVPEDGPAGFEEPEIVSDEGYTYEYEFTEDDAGITTYKCEPHEGEGMKGGVAVGDDVETVQPGGGGGGATVEIPDQALALTLATLIAMGATLGLGYVFMRYAER